MFSPNLTYFVERLQGVSTNTFRLESQNKTTAQQNDIITFDLPSNAILNLRSLKVWCNATANKGAVPSGARLPPISDLVERIEVSVGGIILSQGTNFSNVLQEAMYALQEDSCDSITGHPQYVREKSYVNKLGSGAGILTGTANEDYPQNGNLQYFCIDKFPGFLSTADPKLMDSSLLPDIRVRLYMATDNLLTTSLNVGMGSAAAIVGPPIIKAGFARAGGAGGGRYELTDIHATIEAIGMSDLGYDSMIDSQMKQQGFLEIPYKAYTTFQENHSGASRFTVSTQSLDRVWVAWRIANPNVQLPPVIVDGYKGEGAFISGLYETDAVAQGAAAQGTNLDLGLPGYDIGGVLGTNSEKYKSAYFNFVQPTANMRMQLQLNGAYMPQFSANLGELYGMTRNSLQGAREAKNVSFNQYLNNYCVQCFRLNLPDSEYSRSICGLDTRAVNLQGIVKTDGVVGNPTINIFTEQTETLRVGPGRAIEVIS
tara:strand:+ start:480 stop:1934 length:1455 start_codon:yes stop_codon:yes gene_type:complete